MRVLFGALNRYDIESVAPLFGVLARRGHSSALLGGYVSLADPPSKDMEVFLPPEIGGGSGGGAIRRLLSTCFSAQDCELFTRIIERHSPELDSALSGWVYGWERYFSAFAASAIEAYKPDITVLGVGGIEARMIFEACRLRSVPICQVLPTFFEFKSVEPFAVIPDQEGIDNPMGGKYAVAGPFGKAKLMARGVEESRIEVIGSPRFEGAYRCRRERDSAGAVAGKAPSILYAMQGTAENSRLGSYLGDYLRLRPDVHMVLRSHPDFPSEASELKAALDRSGNLGERLSVDDKAPLPRQLMDCSVLVTLSSLAILEALILEVPSIRWHSSFFPDTTPFVRQNDAFGASDPAELRAALDRVLFQLGFLQQWRAEHKDNYRKYLDDSHPDTSERLADILESEVSLPAPASGNLRA